MHIDECGTWLVDRRGFSRATHRSGSGASLQDARRPPHESASVTIRAADRPAVARALLSAMRTAEITRVIEPLEAAGWGWKPLGGREGNFGLVNIGSDPALALIERFTNAIDAVIERAARETPPELVAGIESPREAAQELFGIGDGRLASLDDASLVTLAAKIDVSLLDGSRRERPTIELRDYGCGITAATMTSSILDLAGSNKVDKRYLAGAYGQGGSTTFAFSGGGTLIASSADGSLGTVTYVRYRALDPRTNKNGRYEYLVDPSGELATFDAHHIDFARGTLVRHFDYELPRHHGALDGGDGLESLARAALFDPVLPLELNDRRSHRRAGARTACFAGAVRTLGRAGSRIELQQSLGVPLGPRGIHGLVAVRYWLLTDDAAALRPDERASVFITNFGQTHDTWGRAFIVDELRLPFLKSALIVQVELDDLTPASKRDLLSSTRDRLKHGELFTTLSAAVKAALADEAALQGANAERRQRLLAKQRAGDHERLQRRFAELLETFRPGAFPAASAHGRQALPDGTLPGGESGVAAEPLPTLEHPSFIRFARDPARIELPHKQSLRILLESDAPDGYVARYPEARLVVATDPLDAVVFVRATDFRGGRARIVLSATAAVGTNGTATVRLTDARGSVHAASVSYAIVDAPQAPLGKTDGNKPVKVPNVFDVTRDRWPEHGFDERDVARVDESRDDISIFINVDNVHLVRLIEAVHYQQTGLTRMRSAFVVQTAFYAFLQHRARKALPRSLVADADYDAYVREEYDRVAQTVVSSIAAIDRIDSLMLNDS